jgi:hypothetical protein
MTPVIARKGNGQKRAFAFGVRVKGPRCYRLRTASPNFHVRRSLQASVLRREQPVPRLF